MLCCLAIAVFISRRAASHHCFRGVPRLTIVFFAACRVSQLFFSRRAAFHHCVFRGGPRLLHDHCGFPHVCLYNNIAVHLKAIRVPGLKYFIRALSPALSRHGDWLMSFDRWYMDKCPMGACNKAWKASRVEEQVKKIAIDHTMEEHGKTEKVNGMKIDSFLETFNFCS